MTWRVVSRASRLAQVQTAEALERLAAAGGTVGEVVTEVLSSFGDKNKHIDLLAGTAPADLFTRELDEALTSGRADFAVHSAKDLPVPLAPGLAVAALLAPADPTDSLVVRAGLAGGLEGLPAGARVGTSSPLRKKSLLDLRPDVVVAGIRGTIEERLAQLDAGAYDAVVVATCALDRLGLEHRAAQRLPFATHPLQGRLAVTCLARRTDVLDLWAPVDERRRWGRVSLVGAGPGEPELLTLKAQRRLAEADVVFHDSLANPAVLAGLKADLVFVGKRGDAGGEAQDRINELLWKAAEAGKAVVRLKGGDPMIFGRAVEELEYLEERLVDIEVVPGISSAQAASAYTQIPLTERGVSSSVAYCLGQPADRITVPENDTLVYYMSSATLGLIVDKVLAAGRSPDTRVALVRNASLPDQQLWLHTLGSLAEELAARPDHPYASPLLTIIGPVARADRALPWFHRLPRVWYTGTNADHYTRPCRLVHRPLVEIRPLDDPSPLDAALRAFFAHPGPKWAVFTSRHTVAAVAGRLAALGLDARAWAGARLAAVGRATAADLASRGLGADLVPLRESSEGLVEALGPLLTPGQRVLLPCSDQALPVLEAGLRARGADPLRVTAYRNVEVPTAPGVDLGALDEVVLTSPTTARAFARWYPEVPASVVLVPWGAQTRRALEQLFPGRPLGPSPLNT